MIESMLSTIDNPYNPFDEFDEWYAWDERSGYHTTSFLARIVQNSDDLSESDQVLAITQGIDEIIRENVNGVYVRVTREIPD
jgi:hypothetical protein